MLRCVFLACVLADFYQAQYMNIEKYMSGDARLGPATN